MTLDGDLQRVRDVLSAVAEAPPPVAGFADVVLQRLVTVIPCDVVSFSDYDVASRTMHAYQDCIDAVVTTSSPWVAAPDDPFFRYYWATPMASYPTRTGDARSVIMRTDFMSDREWHRSPMYVEIFRDRHLDQSMLCCLRNARTRTRRVVFFRSGGSFSERDRQLLALLRPHLAEALSPRPDQSLPPLTARQQELLRLVAAGLTNAEVAARLYLSPHTVRKHLENIYERLDVTTRTAAVARAFPEENVSA